MSKQILVNSSPYETRVATLTDGEIKELHIEREEDRNVVGNIYKGVVKRVLPGMQAAFLELGLERTAFLYVDDIIDEPFGTDVDWEEEDEDEDGDDAGSSEDSPRGKSRNRNDNRNDDDQDDDDQDDDDDDDGENASDEDNRNETDSDDRNEDDDQDDDDDDDGDDEDDDDARSEGSSDDSPSDAPPHFAHRDVERDESFLPTEESLLEENKDLGSATIDAKMPSGKRGSSKKSDGESSEQKAKTGTESRSDSDTPEGADSEPSNEDGEPKTEKIEQATFDEKDPVTIEYFTESGMRRVPKTKGAKLRALDNQRRSTRNDSDRDSRSDRGSRGDSDRTRTDSRSDRGSRGDSDRTRTDSRDGGRDRDDRDRNDRDSRDGNRDRSEGRSDRNRGGSDRGGRGRSSGGTRPRRAARTRGRGGRRPTRRERRKVDIQDLLKEGQEILVQVAKAPIGTKGARLTTHISLPGRNLVLMPTVKHLGISRRIESDRERRRLRDIFTKRIRPEKDVGFIIRTVASGKTFRELKADAEYLLKVWDKIQDQTKKKKAPALIHEDLGLALKTVRDDFTEDVDSYVIDNPVDYERVVDFITPFSPKLKGRVKLFRGPSQLFEHYGIEAEISRALGKKVWLKSGGYLLVDQSEALTAIDVNTGRYVGSKSLEETILKTNLEAVKEISYQLRVRNIGGIIIMDLIDMESAKNRRIVFDALQKALSEDKARTNILKISELGLVEMTRKRTHEDLVRYLTEACHYCEGRGYHKSRRTIVFEIFREIEKEAIASEMGTVVVFANTEVCKTVERDEKRHVGGLEERFSKKILVKPDLNFHVEQFEVFSKP